MPSYNKLPVILSKPSIRVEGIKSSSSGALVTHTFSQDYDLVFAFCAQSDSDNNGDNYIKIFDTDKGAFANTTQRNIIENLWPAFKIKDQGTNAATAFTNAEDLFTVTVKNNGNYYHYTSVRYKDNVKTADICYIYASHAYTVWLIGVNYNKFPIDQTTVQVNNNMEIVNMFSAQSGSTTAASYWTHTFSKNYNAVLVIFTMHDTDNNNDNWCAVYDTARTNANFATWKAQDDTKWAIISTNNITIPADVVRTMAVYSGAEENTKTVEYAPGTSGTAFQALSYKIGVKSGDIAHIYVNTYRRALVTIIGIN